MIECILRLDSLLRILLEHPLDQILEVWTEMARHLGLGVEDRSEEALHVICVKWLISRYDLEEHHPEGPDVTLGAVILLDDLRGDVVRGARDLLGRALHLAGQTEVDEFDSASSLIKHDVLRLDVTMDDILRVNIAQGA